jgi:hypothetical protein
MPKKSLWILVTAYLAVMALMAGAMITLYAAGDLLHGEDRNPAILGLLLFAGAVGFGFLFILIGLAMYVYRDAERRGMNGLLWALVAFFVPYFLGFVIYLLSRKPLEARCPDCDRATPPDAAHCPHCGSALKRQCPSCKAPAEPGFQFCSACGGKLNG